MLIIVSVDGIIYVVDKFWIILFIIKNVGKGVMMMSNEFIIFNINFI